MITATSPRTGSTVARVVLSLVGAVLAIVGAFLPWVDKIAGTDLNWKAFYATNMTSTKSFVMTVGAVFILFGLLGILGLADAGGRLTRAAGALGIVGFVLVAIEIYRAHAQGLSTLTHRFGAGAWIALLGSFVMLIAGFLSTPEVVSD